MLKRNKKQFDLKHYLMDLTLVIITGGLYSGTSSKIKKG